MHAVGFTVSGAEAEGDGTSSHYMESGRCFFLFVFLILISSYYIGDETTG